MLQILFMVGVVTVLRCAFFHTRHVTVPPPRPLLCLAAAAGGCVMCVLQTRDVSIVCGDVHVSEHCKGGHCYVCFTAIVPSQSIK